MSTEEFLDRARKKTNTQLLESIASEDGLQNLDLILKANRALVSLNAEIWQRCLDSEYGRKRDGFLFLRFAYTKIQVATARRAGCNELTLNAIPECESKDFGKPPALPEHLSRIISPPLASDGILIDFETYLETASVLNEETLLHFLVILKKHLEEVHVFLGEIETWLMQPQFCVNFITECFDVCATELSLTGSIDSLGYTHAMCVCCNQSTYYECRPCTSERGHLYFRRNPVLLKSCSVDGDHSHIFDISQQIQQEKIQKFLDFLS